MKINYDINLDFLSENFVKSILNEEIPQFYNNMKSQQDKFEAMENLLIIKEDSEKLEVYNYAVYKTIIQLSDMINMEIDNIKDINEYKEFDYLLYSILEILYNNELLSYHIISKKLNISNQELLDFFNKTNKFELWKCDNTDYYINFKGKQVYKKYKKKNIINFIKDKQDYYYNQLNNDNTLFSDNYIKGAFDVCEEIIKELTKF